MNTCLHRLLVILLFFIELYYLAVVNFIQTNYDCSSKYNKEAIKSVVWKGMYVWNGSPQELSTSSYKLYKMFSHFFNVVKLDFEKCMTSSCVLAKLDMFACLFVICSQNNKQAI